MHQVTAKSSRKLPFSLLSTCPRLPRIIVPATLLSNICSTVIMEDYRAMSGNQTEITAVTSPLDPQLFPSVLHYTGSTSKPVAPLEQGQK